MELVNAQDVSDEILKSAESCYETYFSWQERIDWEEFIDRFEKSYLPEDIEIPDYDNAAVRKIQRHIRQIRAQS
jgi:hypothetical protein